jgi:uncharacterized protein
MDTIHIPQLIKAPSCTVSLDFKECLSELETLTPVAGTLQVTHQGTYLEVVGQAETIVTLTCDRCLQQYNHRLRFETTELIWLETPPEIDQIPQEREVLPDDLVETLPPQGDFEPNTWVYEQLCLAFPQRQLCEANCPGIQVAEPGLRQDSEPAIDQRWASLAALKRQLPS